MGISDLRHLEFVVVALATRRWAITSRLQTPSTTNNLTRFQEGHELKSLEPLCDMALVPESKNPRTTRHETLSIMERDWGQLITEFENLQNILWPSFRR